MGERKPSQASREKARVVTYLRQLADQDRAKAALCETTPWAPTETMRYWQVSAARLKEVAGYIESGEHRRKRSAS